MLPEPPANLHVVSWNEDDARAIDGGTAIGWWAASSRRACAGRTTWMRSTRRSIPIWRPHENPPSSTTSGRSAQHQYDGITPVFSDGSIFAMTFRSWGDFMAAVWSEEEDTDMTRNRSSIMA
jgi:hypothetical protein